MLTPGQTKYAAFKVKVAGDLSPFTSWAAKKPLTSAALLSGIGGAIGLAKHGPWGSGGKSRPEEKQAPKLRAAEKLDQSDPNNREALKKSLSDMRSAVGNAETAGSGLGTAGALYGGVLLNTKLLGKNLQKTEMGRSVSPEEIEAMTEMTHSIMGNKYKVTGDLPSVIQVPQGGVRVGRTIPKGGLWPKVLHKQEERANMPLFRSWAEQLGVHPDSIEDIAKFKAESALKSGLIAAPMDAGPHIAAHEFGHGLFQKSNIGKLTQALRLPALLGLVAGNATAATADPESTASKLSPLMSAAGIAPILGEEAAASLHALGLMKKLQYSPEALSTARRQLGKAFGTYAIGLGAPMIAAPYIIRKIKQYNQARRAEKGLQSSGQLTSRMDALGE